MRNMRDRLSRRTVDFGETKGGLFAGAALVLTAVAGFIACLAAWITHIVVCIQTSAWILLIIGLFVPFIGWIHGFMVWFGLT